jgi:hypothetical protein
LTVLREGFIIGYRSAIKITGNTMLRFGFYWFTCWEAGPAEYVCD